MSDKECPQCCVELERDVHVDAVRDKSIVLSCPTCNTTFSRCDGCKSPLIDGTVTVFETVGSGGKHYKHPNHGTVDIHTCSHCDPREVTEHSVSSVLSQKVVSANLMK